MKPILCGRCGAPVEQVIEDKTRCTYCGSLLKARAPEPVSAPAILEPAFTPPPLPQPAMAPWLGLGLIVMSAGIAAIAAMISTSTPSSVPDEPPAPFVAPTQTVEEAPAPPAPPTPQAPVDYPALRRPLGMNGVRGRVQKLHRQCRVLVKPTMAKGTQELETKFVADGRCVTILASATKTERTLTLQMKTPLGTVLHTPPPAHALEHTVCPREQGGYPTTIEPSHPNEPFAVAVIECARGVAEMNP